jgi:hypothetical protein
MTTPKTKPTLLKRKRIAIQQANALAAQIERQPNAPAAPKPPPPAPVVDWGDVPVQKIQHQPGRFEKLTAPPTFTGKALLPATSCAARALG